MSEDESTEEPKKKSKPIIPLALFLVATGGTFFGLSSGLIPLGAAPEVAASDEYAPKKEVSYDDVKFLEMNDIVTDIRHGDRRLRLRIALSVEVEADEYDAIAERDARFRAALLRYLQALDAETITEPDAVSSLRNNILARFRQVAESNGVRDVLITELLIV